MAADVPSFLCFFCNSANRVPSRKEEREGEKKKGTKRRKSKAEAAETQDCSAVPRISTDENNPAVFGLTDLTLFCFVIKDPGWVEIYFAISQRLISPLLFSGP